MTNRAPPRSLRHSPSRGPWGRRAVRSVRPVAECVERVVRPTRGDERRIDRWRERRRGPERFASGRTERLRYRLRDFARRGRALRAQRGKWRIGRGSRRRLCPRERGPSRRVHGEAGMRGAGRSPVDAWPLSRSAERRMLHERASRRGPPPGGLEPLAPSPRHGGDGRVGSDDRGVRGHVSDGGDIGAALWSDHGARAGRVASGRPRARRGSPGRDAVSAGVDEGRGRQTAVSPGP